MSNPEFPLTRDSLIPPPSSAGHPDWDRCWSHMFLYKPALVRFVQCLLPWHMSAYRRLDAAKEIVADFFCTAMDRKTLRAWRKEGRFRSYLRTLVRRATRDAYRYKKADKRSPKKPVRDIAAVQVIATPVDDVLAKADREFLRSVLLTASRRVLERLGENEGRQKNGALYKQAVLFKLGSLDPEFGDGTQDPPAFTPKQLHDAFKIYRRLMREELRRLPLAQADVDDLLDRFEPPA